MLLGILCGIGAASVWGLTFIVPFVIGSYSIFDFALFQYLFSSMVCGVYLAANASEVRALGRRDWMIALFLGVIGYFGYFLALTGAALHAGPVVAPAFLGLVPLALAIAGNLRRRTVPWRKLAWPLAAAAIGLALVDSGELRYAGRESSESLATGIALALLAVALWTAFGLLNEAALTRRPDVRAGVWTAMIMVGAGGAMMLFAPVGIASGAFNVTHLGLSGAAGRSLLLAAVAGSVLVNLGGALGWTIASQRLPVVLAAQLITLEPTFGAIYGLLVHRRAATTAEVAGMLCLLAGVCATISLTHAHAPPRTCPDPVRGGLTSSAPRS